MEAKCTDLHCGLYIKFLITCLLKDDINISSDELGYLLPLCSLDWVVTLLVLSEILLWCIEESRQSGQTISNVSILHWWKTLYLIRSVQTARRQRPASLGWGSELKLAAPSLFLPLIKRKIDWASVAHPISQKRWLKIRCSEPSNSLQSLLLKRQGEIFFGFKSTLEKYTLEYF